LPAVREDQAASGASAVDEVGGGDRLPGGGRMPEPVAADGAGILRSRQRLGQLLAGVRCELQLVVGLVVLVGLLRVTVAVAVRGLLVRRDELGQHAGERVDLVTAKLSAGPEVRRLPPPS